MDYKPGTLPFHHSADRAQRTRALSHVDCLLHCAGLSISDERRDASLKRTDSATVLAHSRCAIPIEPSLLCTCCCRIHADQPLLVITQLPSEARARTLRSHHRALSGPRSLICARAPSPRQARSASAAAANTAPRSGGTRPPRVQSKAAADMRHQAARSRPLVCR